MRLTLRYMLAYLDNLLEPKDSQDMAKRISESEVASKLMHRIRDVTRRLRLGAPKLEGRGNGLDPNTVAEYLDHALAPDRLLDFERVCLESDVHLAEVACCHQILALVLGEPAEVDPHSRQRMYGLVLMPEGTSARRADGTVVEEQEAQAAAVAVVAGGAAPAKEKETAAPAAAAAASSTAASTAAAEAAATKKKVEIPAYLIDEKKPGWTRWALAASVLVALGLGGWLIADSAARNNMLVALGMSSETPVDNPDAGTPTGGPPADHGQPQDSGDKTKSPSETTKVPSPTTVTPPSDTSQPGSGQRPVPAVEQPKETPATVTPDSTAPTPPVPKPVTPDTSSDTTTPPKPVTPMPPPGDTTPTAPKPPVGTPDTTKPPVETPNPPVTPATNTPTVPKAVPQVREAVGRLMSNQLLVRSDAKTHSWYTLSNQDKLYSLDSFIAFPTERSNIDLGDLRVWLLPFSRVELEAADEQGVLGLNIAEGRLVISTTVNKPGSKVRLRFGDRQGVLVFGDIDSRVALEVSRVRLDGSNPETEPVAVLADLYVAGGSVSWTAPPPAQPEVIRAGSSRALDGRVVASIPLEKFPLWIDHDEPTATDARAAAVIKESLATKVLDAAGNPQPVTIRLKELSDDRRPEVSMMAMQCLALIGDFDWLAPRLNDPAHKGALIPPPERPSLIDAFRWGLSVGPESAQTVRVALEKHYGAKAADMYRMFWGYTPEQLRAVDKGGAGAAKDLVEKLDHADAAFRVLALWNLRHITGNTLFYQPFDLPAKRAQSVQRWHQKLDQDLIKPPSEIRPSAG